MGWSDFCLSFSAVVCVASIRIHFTTTGKAGPLHLFPHLSFPSSTQIIRMPWLTDLPSSFPTHRKDISRMYKRGTNSWCEYFIGFATKPRIVIRDSDDEKKNSSDGARELKDKCWLRLGSSNLVCRRKQRQWLARVILWSVSPEIYHGLCSSTQLFASFWKPTLACLFWHSYIVMTILLVQGSTCAESQPRDVVAVVENNVKLDWRWYHVKRVIPTDRKRKIWRGYRLSLICATIRALNVH